MSEEFFSSKSRVEVTIYCVVEKNKNGFSYVKIINEKKANEMLANDADKDKVKVFRTEWKRPGWAMENSLIAKSTSFNQFKGDNEIDAYKYRDLKLKTYLISWNLKDSKGNEIPLTTEAIDNLQPEIGAALINKYEELTRIDREEQEKN